MTKIYSYLACFILASSAATTAFAQSSPDGLWKTVEPDAVPAAPFVALDRVQPDAFRLYSLNTAALKEMLRRAPAEGSIGAANRPTAEASGAPRPDLTVPAPDGKFLRVRVYEAQLLEPELAAKYPELKAYRGYAIESPETSVQLDFTPEGFHAQVLDARATFYVDPSGRPDEYKSYFRHDHRKRSAFQCLVPGAPDPIEVAREAAPQPILRSGQFLRTYRLAIACTGEYVAFHGGTVPRALSAIHTTVNRVDGIYEAELGIRLVLVNNTDRLIFTDAAADPFHNDNANTLIGESQATIDRIIGSNNYDIGHTFSTGAGGLAGLGVVCQNGQKARGVTGTANPVGDPFDVDFVAHEMGHQFGGNHTFNGARGSCSGLNRNGPTAYEPGSGSTIQAYAGICRDDDLQDHTNPYFHCQSLDEIIRYTTIGAGNRPQAVPTGNSPPTVEAGLTYVIPKSTPFVLTAKGIDPDGDRLTYCWEERDQGPQATLQTSDDGRIPLFRSFEPTSVPERYFPRMADLLNNVSSSSEKLPLRDRVMNFRVTVRDGRGGINGANTQVTVHAAAGPFKVLTPSPGGSFSGATTVTWSVAGTDAAPINAARVNILLSLDGGLTFPFTLAANTPNDGSELVMLPGEPSPTARIKVVAADNIFFAISENNFSIGPVGRAVVVAAVDEHAAPSDLAKTLNSVPVDAIHFVGSGPSRAVAEEFAKRRGLQIEVENDPSGLLEKLQGDAARRRVLIVAPHEKLDTVAGALGAPSAANAGRSTAPAESIHLFTTNLGGEKAEELRPVPQK